MNSVLARHQSPIQETISGFDRRLCVGHLHLVSFASGLARFRAGAGVLLNDCGQDAENLSNPIKQAPLRIAETTSTGRVHCLASSEPSKEEFLRRLPPPKQETGLVAVLSCVAPCRSSGRPNAPETGPRKLTAAPRKCLHDDFDLVHPRFGPMPLRLQTGLPIKIPIGLHGRDWLARQLDAEGIGSLKKDNAVVALDDFTRAQALRDQQLTVNGPRALDQRVRAFPPVHAKRFGLPQPRPDSWTAAQTEWATDVILDSPARLAALYPGRIPHGITTFGSRDVLRSLQRQVPAQGGIHGQFAGEVTSDLKSRPEGLRIQHSCGPHRVTRSDQQGPVLRVETTLHDAGDLKTSRPSGDGSLPWPKLRKGVGDRHRRGERSQAANDRDLAALGAVESPTPLEQLRAPLCRPVVKKGRRDRGLNPRREDDARVWEAVQRGASLIRGFRHRDIRPIHFGDPPSDETRSAAHRIESVVCWGCFGLMV